MPLTDYYENFYLQDWLSFTNNFGDIEWRWGDGAKVRGIYSQDSSAETRLAEAQGVSSVGVFITGSGLKIEAGDVLRRESDGVYIKITGHPAQSPEPATLEFQKMNAAVTPNIQERDSP